MKYIHISLVITALLVISCGKSQDDTVSKDAGKTRKLPGIIQLANTSLRIDPYIFSGLITHLPKGARVEILDKSAKKSWIGKSSDYWYRIRDERGYTGWVYGSTIKILKPGKEEEVAKYLNTFLAEKTEEIKKNLIGKWWSYNQFGDFTNHGLEFYGDGTYRSYTKGGEKWAKTGNYNLDVKNNTIIFLKGASFGKNITFEVAGSTYLLKREMEKYTLKMKKIQQELPQKSATEIDSENK